MNEDVIAVPGGFGCACGPAVGCSSGSPPRIFGQTRSAEFGEIGDEPAFLESVAVDGHAETVCGHGGKDVGPVGEHGQDGVPYLIQFFVRHVVGGKDRDAAGVQVFAIVGMDVERLGG